MNKTGAAVAVYDCATKRRHVKNGVSTGLQPVSRHDVPLKASTGKKKKFKILFASLCRSCTDAAQKKAMECQACLRRHKTAKISSDINLQLLKLHHFKPERF